MSPLTRVQLTSGVVIRTEATLQQVRDAMETALAENRLLEIHDPEGERIVVNPVQIQVIQDVSADSDDDVAPPARTQVPA